MPSYRRLRPGLLAASILIAFALAATRTAPAPAVAARPAAGPLRVVEVERTTVLPDGRTLVAHTLVEADAESNTGATLQATDMGDAGAFATIGAWAARGVPVPVHYVFSADRPALSAFPAMLWAMNRWSSPTGQTFSFAYAGAAEKAPDAACSDVSKSDGINSVSLVASLPTDVLGSTCVLSGRNRDGVIEIFEFDMVFSAEIPWSTAVSTTPAGQVDLYSTVLHEFGHALGLGHSDDPAAVMKPAIHDGEQGRDFSNDDLAAIFSLYGTGATPLATPGAPPASGTGVFQLRLGQVANDQKK